MNTDLKITSNVKASSDETIYVITCNNENIAYTYDHQNARDIVDEMVEHEMKRLEEGEWVKVECNVANNTAVVTTQKLGRAWNSTPTADVTFCITPVNLVYKTDSQYTRQLPPTPPPQPPVNILENGDEEWSDSDDEVSE